MNEDMIKTVVDCMASNESMKDIQQIQTAHRLKTCTVLGNKGRKPRLGNWLRARGYDGSISIYRWRRRLCPRNRYCIP